MVLVSLKECYQAMERDFWVLDITSDLGIPSFVSISCKVNTEFQEILLGFGTHFDPNIAILRAVTEMNQSLGIDFKNGESKPYEPDWEFWLKKATIQNQPYLIPCAVTDQKVFTDYQDRRNDDIKKDILDCIEIISQHGMEVLVLDQTRIDIGMSVVKVIVPEMRHFWNRFAPGRLYDVPVQLGWLQIPSREEDLNPIPMFF